MIVLENVCKSYDSQEALINVSFNLMKGEKNLLLPPVGSVWLGPA
ncbi:hypothetical protein MCHI_000993, partial [Candidatus Magnetoovum chiemensis]